MENFTPVSALVGGALIGLSAVILMAFNGRIAGISSVFSGLALAEPGDRSWRGLFIVGLIAGPLLVWLVNGERPPFEITDNWVLIIAGGLIVGFGTRLGSGCTSGHGVCGISRLSRRSMVAVGIFMLSGMITTTLARVAFGG